MKKKADGLTRALNLGSGFVSLCAGLLAFVLILYSGYVLYDSLAIEARAFSSNSDLLKYKPGVMKEPPEKKERPLQEINPDYRAWITVKDNPIDYPIVQAKDDLYYATHDVYRNVSLTGAIYLAAGNSPNFSDSYNLLYGHHMDNGAMFGSLDRFRNRNYFYKHQTAVITTADGMMYDVTFFAIASTDAYENRIYTVGNRMKDVLKFLTGSRKNDAGIGTDVLIYDKEVVKGAVKVVALSTCASADTNGRLVLFGVMRRRPFREHPVVLTVHYQDEDGTPVLPDEIHIYSEGDTYYVVPPQIPGYDVDIRIVHGTITEDITVIVTYIPKTWKLRIRYLTPDGQEIAPPYEQAIKTGEAYDVESPQIEGWVPTHLRISGTNPGRDENYTVIYVPEGTVFTDTEIYNEPLGLGDMYLQAGVCAE